MIQAARGQREEFRGEPLGRLVGEFREDHLVERLGLRLDGVDDARMPVSMSDHPPGRDGIEDALPVGGKEVGALGAHGFREARGAARAG